MLQSTAKGNPSVATSSQWTPSTSAVGMSTAIAQTTHPWFGLPASKFRLVQRVHASTPL